MKRLLFLGAVLILAGLALIGCAGMFDFTGSNERAAAEAAAQAELERTYQHAIARTAAYEAAQAELQTLQTLLNDRAQARQEFYATMVGMGRMSTEDAARKVAAEAAQDYRTSGLTFRFGLGADIVGMGILALAVLFVLLCLGWLITRARK